MYERFWQIYRPGRGKAAAFPLFLLEEPPPEETGGGQKRKQKEESENEVRGKRWLLYTPLGVANIRAFQAFSVKPPAWPVDIYFVQGIFVL